MHRLIAMSFILLLAVGCGGLDTAKVSGVITLDGKPLANASVTFSPETVDGLSAASNGKTDANGAYSLTVTTTRDEGALIGKHTVTIALIMEESEDEDADVEDESSYEDEVELPLHDFSFEVKSGKNDGANFDLKSGGGS
ncbi:MAG: Ig-like domain-containing protein [Pirellulaceae bacterium]|jgi:hypothetical protein